MESAGHPSGMAGRDRGAVLVVILFALMAWRLMRMVSRRRLAELDDDE